MCQGVLSTAGFCNILQPNNKAENTDGRGCEVRKENIVIEMVLAEPVLARLATTDPKTMQPHVVPVWFMWDGASVWISSFVSTRKIRGLSTTRGEPY